MTTYTVNNTEQEKKIYCGREYEHDLTTNTQYNYIYVGNTPIALYVQGDTNAMYTLHTNYIGSIEKITNTAGEIVDSMSYTPFGQRRSVTEWTRNDTVTHLIDRGFTGQQHLDNFALINFNGRMYDPVLAHFLSPDPYIQSPENPLNYNRYAYCLFSPLQYVDPSGMTIHLIGGAKKKTIFYLQKMCSNLTISIDKKGILSYSVNDNVMYKKNGTPKITYEENLLCSIIDNQSISISLIANWGNRFKSKLGNIIHTKLGGGFGGSTYNNDETADAEQYISMNLVHKYFHLYDIGSLILHEISEAYCGAKIAIKEKRNTCIPLVDESQCLDYDNAHGLAYPQPIPIFEKLHMKKEEFDNTYEKMLYMLKNDNILKDLE